jgi:hypothetical protein
LTEVDGEGQSVRTKLYNWVSDVQKFTAQYLETCVQEVRGEKGGEGRMSRNRGKGTIIEKSEEKIWNVGREGGRQSCSGPRKVYPP